MKRKRIVRGLFALAFGFAMAMIPVSLTAQTAGGVVQGTKHGIEKGAGAVGQGVEGAANKTKEGAEAVGQGTKKAITGEENNPDKTRMKSTEAQTQTESTETKSTETGKTNLPKTAGELPLLALTGFLALAGAAASRFGRRLGKSRG
jgi:hypothetical protein